jgi:hypothetical protein
MKATAGSGWTYAGIDRHPRRADRYRLARPLSRSRALPSDLRDPRTAAGIITRAVKAVPVKQAGYSGLMLAVLEDDTLLRRWSEGTTGSIRSWRTRPSAPLAWIQVPLAGNTSEDAIARISAMSRRWRLSGISRWRRGCCRRPARRWAT